MKGDFTATLKLLQNNNEHNCYERASMRYKAKTNRKYNNQWNAL